VRLVVDTSRPTDGLATGVVGSRAPGQGYAGCLATRMTNSFAAFKMVRRTREENPLFPQVTDSAHAGLVLIYLTVIG
jgi:hypothetical protein